MRKQAREIFWAGEKIKLKRSDGKPDIDAVLDTRNAYDLTRAFRQSKHKKGSKIDTLMRTFGTVVYIGDYGDRNDAFMFLINPDGVLNDEKTQQVLTETFDGEMRPPPNKSPYFHAVGGTQESGFIPSVTLPSCISHVGPHLINRAGGISVMGPLELQTVAVLKVTLLGQPMPAAFNALAALAANGDYGINPGDELTSRCWETEREKWLRSVDADFE